MSVKPSCFERKASIPGKPRDGGSRAVDLPREATGSLQRKLQSAFGRWRMKPGNIDRWFVWACGFELGLLGIAALLGGLLRQPVWAALHWNLRDFLVGVLSALPLFGLFWWTLRSRARPLFEIRDFLETVVRPLFGRWSLWQLAVISALAGICEESLFRAALQGGLQPWTGTVGAWFLASVAFGLAHCVRWAYGAIAVLIGLYLGGLWLASDNLLVPVLCHATYDFGALVFFLRAGRPLWK